VFAKGWLSELSYTELVSEVKSQSIGYKWGKKLIDVSIDHVIDLADKVLGYDCMLIVGAIADVIDGMHGHSDDISTNLRTLQKAIKYGLSKPLSIWLYENKFADRELCKHLTGELERQGVDPFNFKYDLLDNDAQAVKAILTQYPSYFSK
jgi:hypothetical protein